MKPCLAALILVCLSQLASAADWTMSLQCAADGGLIRLSDNRRIANNSQREECLMARDAARGGVICVYFNESMPIGPGGWVETGWRAMNISKGFGLGSSAFTNRAQCLEATRAAAGGVVCTFTGLGMRATHVDTNLSCGASMQLKYCLESTRDAVDHVVCSFPSSGTGAEPGWMRTRISDSCEYQGDMVSLSACKKTIPPAPAPTPF